MRHLTNTRDPLYEATCASKGTLPNFFFLKINVNMTLRGGGGQGLDANFNMNFELSFLVVGLELVSTRSYMMSVRTTLTCISAAVFKTRYFCHDAKRGGRGSKT